MPVEHGMLGNGLGGRQSLVALVLFAMSEGFHSGCLILCYFLAHVAPAIKAEKIVG